MIDYIGNNNFELNNLIFVCDRAYFSYDLINYLESKNINYVIRAKNNSLYLDKNKIKKEKEKQKNSKNIKRINNENVRFVTFRNSYIITKKDKKRNDVNLKRNIECNVVTNLNIKDYNDEEIKKIYVSRWDSQENKQSLFSGAS